jgi:hypothetical protein
MFRSVRNINLGQGQERIQVRIETVPCEWGTAICRERRQHLLESLANDSMLLQCGDQDFKKLSITHNGERWVVEAEATVDRR